MKHPFRGFTPLVVSLALLLPCAFLACADTTPPVAETETAPPAETTAPPVATEQTESAADQWWNHLSSLCGQAFAGALSSSDAVDADFAKEVMTMHVRRCDETRLEVPFHVGDNRSRTWVLTRTDDGIQLQHDHRHEDGTEDEVTLYGGHTEGPGTANRQDFPADDYSKQLFTTHGLDASVANIWSMELVPGERFSYIMRRPERHFQVDFDLSQSVTAPPAPWGHE